MKKVLLSTAALAALAVSAPAFAQEESGVKLDVGGYFKGYGVYVDQDQDTNRNIDLLRDTEVHFSGETTLDNGLTVGAHIEAGADGADGFAVDESYAYFSGSWGRVNVGKEDGAAFLLQVAAPSADSNVDGIRQYVNPFSDTVLNFGGAGLDYAQDVSGKFDKVTYLSPVFSGFQGGMSWTPGADANSLTGVHTDGTNDVYDAALRYEGKFDSVAVTVGGGYSYLTGTDGDGDAWNLGADFGFGAFGLGVVYTTEGNAADEDTDTWAVGGDYTTGPFTLGASYLTQDDEIGTDSDTDRYTGGVTYAYGPGMTFRGSVSYQQEDVADRDGTAVMLGTQVNF